MSNLSVRQLEINGCNKNMFKSFFEIDSDFEENEEYFREDTLKLGFKNEAERCSHELFDKYKDEFHKEAYIDVLQRALEEAGETSVEGTQHIYGNDTYTSGSEITLICLDEQENSYVAVVSLVGS